MYYFQHLNKHTHSPFYVLSLKTFWILKCKQKLRLIRKTRVRPLNHKSFSDRVKKFKNLLNVYFLLPNDLFGIRHIFVNCFKLVYLTPFSNCSDPRTFYSSSFYIEWLHTQFESDFVFLFIRFTNLLFF